MQVERDHVGVAVDERDALLVGAACSCSLLTSTARRRREQLPVAQRRRSPVPAASSLAPSRASGSRASRADALAAWIRLGRSRPTARSNPSSTPAPPGSRRTSCPGVAAPGFAQVVLGVGALRPLRGGLALQEAVEDVVVVDVQPVADLASAEPFRRSATLPRRPSKSAYLPLVCHGNSVVRNRTSGSKSARFTSSCDLRSLRDRSRSVLRSHRKMGCGRP